MEVGWDFQQSIINKLIGAKSASLVEPTIAEIDRLTQIPFGQHEYVYWGGTGTFTDPILLYAYYLGRLDHKPSVPALKRLLAHYSAGSVSYVEGGPNLIQEALARLEDTVSWTKQSNMGRPMIDIVTTVAGDDGAPPGIFSNKKVSSLVAGDTPFKENFERLTAYLKKYNARPGKTRESGFGFRPIEKGYLQGSWEFQTPNLAIVHVPLVDMGRRKVGGVTVEVRRYLDQGGTWKAYNVGSSLFSVGSAGEHSRLGG